MRSRIRPSSSRLSRFGTNHDGYCMSTAPSFPAFTSGRSASTKRDHTSSSASGSRWWA